MILAAGRVSQAFERWVLDGGLAWTPSAKLALQGGMGLITISCRWHGAKQKNDLAVHLSRQRRGVLTLEGLAVWEW